MKRHEINMFRWGGIGFLVLGVIWIPIAISAYVKVTASTNWPNVMGTITQSDIEKSLVRVKFQGMKESYKARVKYSYSVESRTYFGDKVALYTANASTDPALANGLVAKYPVGKSVQIYYDPREPSVAVLETGSTGDNVFFFVLALVCLAFGVVLTLVAKYAICDDLTLAERVSGRRVRDRGFASGNFTPGPRRPRSTR